MQRDIEKNCVVLVSSCDAYSDLWDIFFDLLKKYWPDNPYRVVLNTESKQYQREDIEIQVINTGDVEISWSERLSRVLTQIPSDYILLMLEDFFLTDFVDTARVTQCFQWIQKDANIASFTFWPTTNDGEPGKYPGFELRPQVGLYKVNAILGLWRKEKLLSYLDFKENAWQFELFGTQRSFTCTDDFYVMQNTESSIFPYNFGKYGLFAGQWLKDTVSLFQKEKIQIEYSKRGFYNPALRSLSKSISAVFEFDSAIVPYYNLQNAEDSYQKTVETIFQGIFQQTYSIEGARDVIRWELATQWGFSVSNLIITVVYQDSTSEIIQEHALFGNGLHHQDKWIFNLPAPYLFIMTKPHKLISTLIIQGNIVCPAETPLLYAAAKVKPKVPFRYRKIEKLFWCEFLASKTKMSYFRMDSALKPKLLLGFNKNSSWIKTGNCIKQGKFKQIYNLSDFSCKKNTKIIWKPASQNGFAIKNMKVTLHHKNGSNILLPSRYINTKKICTMDNYLIFTSDTQNLIITIPENNVFKISIAGSLYCPVPKKILRKMIKSV